MHLSKIFVITLGAGTIGKLKTEEKKRDLCESSNAAKNNVPNSS